MGSFPVHMPLLFALNSGPTGQLLEISRQTPGPPADVTFSERDSRRIKGEISHARVVQKVNNTDLV